MARLLGQNDEFQIKEMFEIRDEHETGHAAGLVVVLDRQVIDPSGLVGEQAVVFAPDGHTFGLEIDSAKDHLQATSLFFRGKTVGDVPMKSRITIETTTAS